MQSFTRREALIQAGRISTALAVGLPPENAAGKTRPEQRGAGKLKVIVAGGHPGDPEYGCGGTVALYTDLGNEVILLYLNNGEWPAEKGGAPASVRMAEANKACQILMARPAYAAQRNGYAVLDSAHFDEYRKILETERKSVV